jgi:hypothetical protein
MFESAALASPVHGTYRRHEGHRLRFEGWTMWALFAEEQQVSRAFRTEREAWHLARKSSLIDHGRLPKGFEIRKIAERLELAAAHFPVRFA